MTDWREVRLGELLTIKHGYAFKGESFSSIGQEVVLTPGNFPVGGGMQFRPGKEKYYTAQYPPEYRLSPGELLVVMTDLKQDAPILGSPALVPDEPPVLHNQRLGLVRPKEGVELDFRFLYYLLLFDGTRSQLRATATGSTVRHTAPERIYQAKVFLPPPLAQRTIGAVLDALDRLIDVDRRRIEQLEQMAQAIYREWFVHFRYPGHENANLIDSPLGPIPTEWQVVTIGQAVELHYGKALRANNRMGGRVAVIGSSGVVGHHDEELVEGPAIVVGRKGNVGNVVWSPRGCWPIDTTYYVSTHLPLRYVYEQLCRAAFMNTHAAVPGLSREQAYSLPFLLPPPRLMSMFANFSDTLGALVVPLTEQMQRLVWIRDLLLPKLVTGQIDVSRLDLGAVVESVT